MAHLEVQQKPKRPSWIWVLVAVIAILLGITLFNYCNTGTAPSADKTVNDTP